MSSIYDALQRIQEQKELLSSKGPRDDSLKRGTILRLIVVTVIISSVGTAGIFYGIRMLKDGNGVVDSVSIPVESQVYAKTVTDREHHEGMQGDQDPFAENRTDVEAGFLDPKNSETYMALGRRYYETGEYDKAMAVYTRALKEFPGDARLLNNIGGVFLARGEREKAIEYFVQASVISEHYVEPLYNMACAYAMTGDKIKALGALKKAYEQNPEVGKWAAGDTDLGNLEGIAEFEAIIHEQ